MSSRTLALHALRSWQEDRNFADAVIAELLGRSRLGASDRAFALELFYGVLRNLTLLDFWIGRLRSAPVDATARDLLRLGLYQLLLLETPAHAAVFETVALAPSRARKLINALLRRADRERISLTNAAEAQPASVRFSHPEFLFAKWSQEFGAEIALELCRWNNQPALVYARINRLQTTPTEFLQKYPESSPLPGKENFVRLRNLRAVAESGDGYIQDPSTALACELLSPQPGESVLDACAAPGGKAAYLAEMMLNQGTLVAADRDEERRKVLRDNLVRLGASGAQVVLIDWLHDGQRLEQRFDKILVDAPCSNSGVMRRRVDVRWRLRPDDFARMQQRQVRILAAVAPLLRPGGSLVYSTCSLEPEENEEVVAIFLRDRPEFRLTTSRKSLPWRDGFDGAFAARLDHAATGRFASPGASVQN